MQNLEKQVKEKILKLRKEWGIPVSLPIAADRIIQKLRAISTDTHTGVQECFKNLIGEELMAMLNDVH